MPSLETSGLLEHLGPETMEVVDRGYWEASLQASSSRLPLPVLLGLCPRRQGRPSDWGGGTSSSSAPAISASNLESPNPMSSPLSSKVGEEERARCAGRALGILGDAARGRPEAARRETRATGGLACGALFLQAVGSALVFAANSGSAAIPCATVPVDLFGGGALAICSGAFGTIGVLEAFAIEVRTRGGITLLGNGDRLLWHLLDRGLFHKHPSALCLTSFCGGRR